MPYVDNSYSETSNNRDDHNYVYNTVAKTQSNSINKLSVKLVVKTIT